MGTYIVIGHRFAYKADSDGQVPPAEYANGDEIEIPDDYPGLDNLLQKGMLESKSHAEKRAEVEQNAGKPDSDVGGDQAAEAARNAGAATKSSGSGSSNGGSQGSSSKG